MKKFALIIVVTAAAIFYACGAHAAVLTVSPASIILDTQGKDVNAVELHLRFDPQEFSIAVANDGGSIINVWIERPTFSNTVGTLDLSGIIPGGLVTKDGTIAKFIITPTHAGIPIRKGFMLANGQVLLNDGSGTPATFTVQYGSAVVLSPAASSTSSTSTPSGPASATAFGADLHAPDPFLPVVARDPSIFAGKYFIAFAATDQVSGIDRYEVLEVPQGSNVGNITVWQAAVSPYLLSDQSLQSDIYVRAFDRAGNFRTVKISEAGTAAGAGVGGGAHPVTGREAAGWAGLGVLLIGISLLLWNRKKRRS